MIWFSFSLSWDRLLQLCKSPVCDHLVINKLTFVFHASAPAIDHEFRHNLVEVAVLPGALVGAEWLNGLGRWCCNVEALCK